MLPGMMCVAGKFGLNKLGAEEQEVSFGIRKFWQLWLNIPG
ncbi:hypothetical protein ES708_05519 [subsurface metagenome]